MPNLQVQNCPTWSKDTGERTGNLNIDWEHNSKICHVVIQIPGHLQPIKITIQKDDIKTIAAAIKG
jgi:hypothetical protein